MEWLDKLAHLEFIKQYIGMFIFIALSSALVIWMVVVAIVDTYKAHSDKYKYDWIKNKYVRIEDNDRS